MPLANDWHAVRTQEMPTLTSVRKALSVAASQLTFPVDM